MIAYMSIGQLCGCSMRWPSLRKSNNCSVNIPGYGVPPSVKISHKQIPNDQLLHKTVSELVLVKKRGRLHPLPIELKRTQTAFNFAVAD